MKIFVLLPAYNEEKSILTLIPEIDKVLKAEKFDYQIIICNDGSNDKTRDILNENIKHKVIRNKSNIGKGASIRKGVNIASNQNLILMDGDLEIDIDEIPVLIKKYEKRLITISIR